MGEYIEAPLVFFGAAFCVVSFLMLRGRRRLARIAEEAELNGSRSRESFASGKYLDPVSHRAVLGLASGTLITLAMVGATGFAAVYYLALQPLILLVVVVGAYAVFTQMDSVEAMFLARFLWKVGVHSLGRNDLEWISWADRRLRIGTWSFFALGAATLLLSLVTGQLVAALNTAVGYYARFLYGIGDAVSPISWVLGVMAMVLVLAGTSLVPGIAWIRIYRRLHRKPASDR